MQKQILIFTFFFMQNIFSEVSCLFILGHAGTGKDTLCEELKNKKNYAVFNAGEIFKQELKKHPEIAKNAFKIHQKTGAFPADTVWDLIEKSLENLTNENSHVAINGFPRDEENVKKAYSKVLQFPQILVVVLTADKNIRWERVQQRKSSSRFDDNKESFDKRTIADESKISNILNEFKEYIPEDKFITIDTTNENPEDVYLKLEDKLKNS